MFKYTSLTPHKKLNSLIYRMPFYVNVYRSYKLSKNSRFFGPPCSFHVSGNPFDSCWDEVPIRRASTRNCLVSQKMSTLQMSTSECSDEGVFNLRRSIFAKRLLLLLLLFDIKINVTYAIASRTRYIDKSRSDWTSKFLGDFWRTGMRWLQSQWMADCSTCAIVTPKARLPMVWSRVRGTKGCMVLFCSRV